MKKQKVNKNLIKIEKVGKKTIYFDKKMAIFLVDEDFTSPSYIELKRRLVEDSKTDFEKDFFVINIDGIKKFKSKKRFFDYFLGEYVYYGKKEDDYFMTNYAQSDVYQTNKKNKKIYERQQEIQKKINELEKEKQELIKKLATS